MTVVFLLLSINDLLEFVTVFDIFQQLLSLVLVVLFRIFDNSYRLFVFNEGILFVLSEIHRRRFLPDRIICVQNFAFKFAVNQVTSSLELFKAKLLLFPISFW